MELSVHGKQIDVGDSLRGHVKEKIEDLSEKYFNHTTFANITFSKEGHGHARTRAHISIKLGKNIMVVADAVETDPYIAFDSAAEKAGKQLRRYKRKLRDHHERTEQSPEAEITKARDYVLATGGHDKELPSEQSPAVIAEMATNIETLTVSDAVMRLELADLPALMFRNASHNGLNMVFRRPDGNVGWVDPESRAKKL
ncbi:MAG: ribosome-associated translation inhibitor RaiA [Alphaproteobacteria bacterium]